MFKSIILFILFLFLIYCLLIAIVYLGQASSIFKPGPKGDLTPKDFGVNFQQFTIVNPSGLALEAWWINGKTNTTLLYLHGNAAVLSDLAQVAKIFYEWGFCILFIEYRSYGGSQKGILSEAGVLEDAISAYDWLVTNHKKVDIVWGHSLGSSIASHLSVKRKINKLILEAPFPSIADMAKVRFPWLPIINSWIKNPFNTLNYLNDPKSESKNSPVLIIHGTSDQVVPYNQGVKVFENLNRDKKLISIANMDHNQFPDLADNYKDEILSWVSSSDNPPSSNLSTD